MDQTGCLMNQSGCGRSAADTGKPIFNLASAFCRQLDSAPSEQCHCTRLILCSSLASLALSCSFDQQALSCTTGASDIGQRLNICFLSSRLPFNNFEPPEYLDGSLRKSRRNVSFAPVCCPSRHFVTRFSCNIAAAGDRGFDPLRLGATWGNPPDESDSSQSRIGWLVGC